MKPVDGVHFFNEGTLADDGTYEVEREGREVLPVTGHHSTNCGSLFADCGGGVGVVDPFDVVFIGEGLFNLRANVIHRMVRSPTRINRRLEYAVERTGRLVRSTDETIGK